MIKREGIIYFFIGLMIGLLVCGIDIKNTSAQSLPSLYNGSSSSSADIEGWISDLVPTYPAVSTDYTMGPGIFDFPRATVGISTAPYWPSTNTIGQVRYSSTNLYSWSYPLIPPKESDPELESLTIIPSRFNLTGVRSKEKLTVLGYYSDRSVKDLTMGTTRSKYISSDTGVAIVDDNGVVTAIGDGTAAIVVINNGIVGIATVTVTIPSNPEIEPVVKSITYQMGLCEVTVEKNASGVVVTSPCKITGPGPISDLKIAIGEDGDYQTIGWMADDTIIEAHSSPGCYYYVWSGQYYQICDY